MSLSRQFGADMYYTRCTYVGLGTGSSVLAVQRDAQKAVAS